MAQVDFFLKVKGSHSGVIPGESGDKKHKGEIDVVGWGWGTSQATDLRTNNASAKVQMHDLVILKRIDIASPLLIQMICHGERMPEVILVCRKAGSEQVDYLTITLTNSIFTSYRINGGVCCCDPGPFAPNAQPASFLQSSGKNSSDTAVPLEQFSIAFQKIQFDYKPQKPDGSLGASKIAIWNSAENV